MNWREKGRKGERGRERGERERNREKERKGEKEREGERRRKEREREGEKRKGEKRNISMCTYCSNKHSVYDYVLTINVCTHYITSKVNTITYMYLLFPYSFQAVAKPSTSTDKHSSLQHSDPQHYNTNIPPLKGHIVTCGLPHLHLEVLYQANICLLHT